MMQKGGGMQFTVIMDEHLKKAVLKTFAELSSQLCFRLWMMLVESLPGCMNLQNILISWANKESDDGCTEDLVAFLIFDLNIVIGACVTAKLPIKTSYNYNTRRIETVIEDAKGFCDVSIKREVEIDMYDSDYGLVSEQIKISVLRAISVFLGKMVNTISIEKEDFRISFEFSD